MSRHGLQPRVRALSSLFRLTIIYSDHSITPKLLEIITSLTREGYDADGDDPWEFGDLESPLLGAAVGKALRLLSVETVSNHGHPSEFVQKYRAHHQLGTLPVMIKQIIKKEDDRNLPGNLYVKRLKGYVKELEKGGELADLGWTSSWSQMVARKAYFVPSQSEWETRRAWD